MADERQFVGPYELVDVIGKGAQASIYRAIYTGEDRPGLVNGQVVALKRMVVDDQYFDRQGDFGVELKHKNIVQYLDHFREDGFEERPCIVMEYLEGYTLEDAINESVAKGGLDWDVVRHIFFQCMEGFVFAYSQGVVHRDIKPANVLLSEQGEAARQQRGEARRELSLIKPAPAQFADRPGLRARETAIRENLPEIPIRSNLGRATAKS